MHNNCNAHVHLRVRMRERVREREEMFMDVLLYDEATGKSGNK